MSRNVLKNHLVISIARFILIGLSLAGYQIGSAGPNGKNEFGWFENPAKQENYKAHSTQEEIVPDE
jgi:hypothetical protein